jgi:hypothetical protein
MNAPGPPRPCHNLSILRNIAAQLRNVCGCTKGPYYLAVIKYGSSGMGCIERTVYS